MKIGILTRRYGFNMGSSLQAYAMVEMIRSLGHDVEIIDYDETSGHFKWKLRPSIDHILYNFKLSISSKKRAYLNHRINQEYKFQTFEDSYLPLSDKTFVSKRELSQYAREFDKIIVGSDQIWNPKLFDPIYFGNFLQSDNRNKIIAYAPSIAVSSASLISQEQCNLMKSLTNISCREEIGAKIIEQITGRRVPVVLDPTLMVDKNRWYDIAESNSLSTFERPYIVTYFLGKVYSTYQEEIEIMATKHSAVIINLSMFNKPNSLKAHRHMRNIGPEEFLYLIKNAEAVVTDSFHAIIFSWIFEKDFKVFMRFNSNDPYSQNSRIDTLLKYMGRRDAIVNRVFTRDQPIIEKMKIISFDFLKTHLKK